MARHTSIVCLFTRQTNTFDTTTTNILSNIFTHNWLSRVSVCRMWMCNHRTLLLAAKCAHSATIGNTIHDVFPINLRFVWIIEFDCWANLYYVSECLFRYSRTGNVVRSAKPISTGRQPNNTFTSAPRTRLLGHLQPQASAHHHQHPRTPVKKSQTL